MGRKADVAEPFVLTALRESLAATIAITWSLTYPQAIGGLVLLHKHEGHTYSKSEVEAVLTACFGTNEQATDDLFDFLVDLGWLSLREHGDRDDEWEVSAP